jgi:hypothetical protein
MLLRKGVVERLGKRTRPPLKVAQSKKEAVRDAYEASRASYGHDENEKYLLNRGYTLDGELSGERQRVYHHEKKKSIVAFRGTQDAKDLSNDVEVATGLYGEDFKNAGEIVKKAEKGRGVLVTGHSLGGTKAIIGGGKNEIITFNPGTGLFGLSGKGGTHFVGEDDPISSRLYGGEIHSLKGLGHGLAPMEKSFE